FVAVLPDGTVRSVPEPARAKSGEVALSDVAEALADAVFGANPPPLGDRQALGGAAKDHWRKNSIPGSRWAHMAGCQLRSPSAVSRGGREHSIGCGMGSAAHESWRFLELYADPRR